MKKSLIILIILTAFFISNAHAFNCMDKLARGAYNMFVSPLEFFQIFTESMEKYDPALAIAYGVVGGAINTAKRAGVGLFEVVTFLVPIPADYGPIIEEPAFLTEKKAMEAEALRLKLEAEKGMTNQQVGNIR